MEQAARGLEGTRAGHDQVDAGADRPPAGGRFANVSTGSHGGGHYDPPDVVWPEPCAGEIPDPELLDDPELDDPTLPEEPELPEDPELLADPAMLDDPALPEDELVPDEPLELLPAEAPPVPALAVLVWCAAPGRVKAITPAPTSPAAPTPAVAARSRACPRRRAAAAARTFGSGEFIGIPSWLSPQSGCRGWGSPRNWL